MDQNWVITSPTILAYQAPSTGYQPSWLRRMDQIARIKRLIDYPTYNRLLKPDKRVINCPSSGGF